MWMCFNKLPFLEGSISMFCPHKNSLQNGSFENPNLWKLIHVENLKMLTIYSGFLKSN